MSERRWLAELDEHDRDLYETELAEEKAWMERQIDADRAYYLLKQVAGLLPPRFEGYDENDPYDRLKSEGGHLSE